MMLQGIHSLIRDTTVLLLNLRYNTSGKAPFAARNMGTSATATQQRNYQHEVNKHASYWEVQSKRTEQLHCQDFHSVHKIFMFSTFSVAETGFCSSPWILYNGHCFHLNRTERTWSDAQRECRNSGGDLVSIRNVEDQSFVVSQLGYGT